MLWLMPQDTDSTVSGPMWAYLLLLMLAGNVNVHAISLSPSYFFLENSKGRVIALGDRLESHLDDRKCGLEAGPRLPKSCVCC